jgi:hypothetical protein
LAAADVAAFRHELWNEQQEPLADPNELRDGYTCVQKCFMMIEELIVQSLCSSHIVENDTGTRLQQTWAKIKNLLQIAKTLIQDRRTISPDDYFLRDLPTPYFLLAVIKTVCADYPDPVTGENPDPLDIMAVAGLFSEILRNPQARHYKHVQFLSKFPKIIRSSFELTGAERFDPTPATAQRLMHMAFIFNEPVLFQRAAMTHDLYAVGNLSNWDEVLAVLQENPDKYADFFFGLLSSKLKVCMWTQFHDGMNMKKDLLIPEIHVSHRLMEISGSVFGDRVANAAVLLRQRYLRPACRRLAVGRKHSLLAEEINQMSWNDVCTAVRSFS